MPDLEKMLAAFEDHIRGMSRDEYIEAGGTPYTDDVPLSFSQTLRDATDEEIGELLRLVYMKGRKDEKAHVSNEYFILMSLPIMSYTDAIKILNVKKKSDSNRGRK